MARIALGTIDLDAVNGGIRWEQAVRESNNVEDRRNDPAWTPTEDGRLVGPNGEWTWDQPNQSQPQTTFSPTEDGYLYGSDGQLYQDDSINSTIRQQEAQRQLESNPEYQELQDYNRDVLSGTMTPTEDGYVVGQSGRAYVDPSINQNQYQERTPEPGEYVPRADGYEPPGGSFEPGNTNTNDTNTESNYESPTFDAGDNGGFE